MESELRSLRNALENRTFACSSSSSPTDRHLPAKDLEEKPCISKHISKDTTLQKDEIIDEQQHKSKDKECISATSCDTVSYIMLSMLLNLLGKERGALFQ